MRATIERDTILPLFNLSELGHRLRGARYLAGYANPGEVNDALMDRFGIKFPERSIRAVERGEQKPTAEMLFVLTMLYSPPGGLSFFAPAVDQQERVEFESLCGPSSTA